MTCAGCARKVEAALKVVVPSATVTLDPPVASVTGAAMDGAAGSGLEVRDVVMSYSGVTVLKGVSIAVRPGEVIGLVGHNGAGK